MDRDPRRYYSGLTWAEKADGTRLTGRASERLAREVEPSTDFSGLWARDTARTGFFYAVKFRDRVVGTSAEVREANCIYTDNLSLPGMD